MILEIISAVGFGVFSIILLWIGWNKGFFLIPYPSASLQVPLYWYHVVVVFGLYFLSVSIGAPFLMYLIQLLLFNQSPILIGSLVNFLTSALILCCILVYIYSLPRATRLHVVQRNPAPSYKLDIQYAFFALILSFPLVIFFNELLTLFLYFAFHIKSFPDQVAVYFLKMALRDPLSLFLSVFTIIILAPLTEETLFRGFLQSFFRKYLTPKSAIFITAVCFSCFHFSYEQGFANIPIISSLFILSLFLGFIYERQGSLFASIILHSFFNIINVVNLFFFGNFLNGSI